MEQKAWERWFAVAASCTIFSAIAYCSWPLGFWLNASASRAGLASELGAAHQPFDWLFVGADIASGALLILASLIMLRLFHAHSWAKTCLIALATYGVSGAFDAALPLRCLPSEAVCGPILKDPVLLLHGAIDLVGSVALVVTLVAGWLYVRKHHTGWTIWVYIIGGGGLLFAGLSLLFIVFGGPGYWAQRYYLTLSCVWVASIPFVLHARHYRIIEKPDATPITK